MSAMDTANFWIEYIIRNGADVLRSPAIDLYWYQAELLDIYGFLVLSGLAIIYLQVSILKLVVNRIFKMFKNSLSSKKKD